MRPLYIFDLDGTLSSVAHRMHLIQQTDAAQRRWREFYEACDQDQPNFPVIGLLNQLRMMNNEIWIFTGRSDIVREKTERWLCTHTSLSLGELAQNLMMRRDGDYQEDHHLKQSWLNRMTPIQRQQLAMVFEDRDRVVQMWRENGVVCCQVANGAF